MKDVDQLWFEIAAILHSAVFVGLADGTHVF
jgi:hypothetical protein